MEHQQENFTFQTALAQYYCQHETTHVGKEHWDVNVVYLGSAATATFNLPIEWSRVMVFQFLSDMES